MKWKSCKIWKTIKGVKHFGSALIQENLNQTNLFSEELIQAIAFDSEVLSFF